jgi:hypothetical protein
MVYMSVTVVMTALVVGRIAVRNFDRKLPRW